MLLADQPWQAHLMAKVGNEILLLEPSAKISLVFTDYYTFFHRQDYLRGLRNGFPGVIKTQEAIFKNWQINSNEFSFDINFLKEWEEKNCTKRTLDELAKTNQWMYGNERDRYHRKFSNQWRTKILYDTIIWCETIINEINPDFIISIERCTLPTNIFFHIATRKNINFYSFIPARVGKRWIVRNDLAYGMSEQMKKFILSKYSNSDSLDEAQKYVQYMRRSLKGIYNSPSHQIEKIVERKRKFLFRSLILDLRKWLGRVYCRIFIQPKERSFHATRLLENFVLLSYVEFRSIVINYAHHIGFNLWGFKRVPKVPYFLWTLHMRPEGSGLVLGDARDEVKELLKVASKLPIGYSLAVKENPEMFGLRERGFYRTLKKKANIILIDPFMPTFPLIEASLGVIGISGTVLMEAPLLNKPSCALGHPEFEGFLVESGWNNSESFINKVIEGKYPDPYLPMLKYLAYVLDHSEENGVSYDGDLENPEIGNLVKNFATKILSSQNFIN